MPSLDVLLLPMIPVAAVLIGLAAYWLILRGIDDRRDHRDEGE